METLTPTATQANIELVQKCYAFFGEGNIPELLNQLSDDVKWTSPGPKNLIPWAGDWEGKAGVGEFFKTLNQNIEFEDFQTKEFIAQNDKVVTIGNWRGKSR